MKTRNDLYSREAAELLRVVSEYRTLLTEQLYRLFPGKTPVIKTLLATLVKQVRIVYNPQMDRYVHIRRLQQRRDYSIQPEL